LMQRHGRPAASWELGFWLACVGLVARRRRRRLSPSGRPGRPSCGERGVQARLR
jgi:hypothetical protein